jgi:hypothetical protein
MANLYRLLILALLTLPAVVAQSAMAGAQPQAIEVRVDPRVELLSIVFRLAGNPEYSMPSAQSPYSEAVEAHFGPFRDHPVIQRARLLRQQRGISYDAVMSLAVHLKMDQAMIPSLRTPLKPRPPQLENRWTTQDAAEFVDLLAAFARDADFKAFIEQQSDFHARAAEALATLVNSQPIIPWFDNFFGSRAQAKYVVFAGLLNGGSNYGVSYRSADGSDEEITPVIGIWRWSDEGVPDIGTQSLGTIIHEFCHPYANAAINRFGEQLDPAGAKLFSANRAVMQRQAYGKGRTVLYESLVRACVVRYMAHQLGDEAAARQAEQEVARGFKWTPALAKLLAEYEADRASYPAFDDFMPRVVEFFEGAAADAVAAAEKAPRVLSIVPANGARDVDPATAELVITFDRPMRDGSWAIVRVPDGEIPGFQRPGYDAARKVLRVPMKLVPGTSYRFWLNAEGYMSFASADGTPLEPVEVSFTTRRE